MVNNATLPSDSDFVSRLFSSDARIRRGHNFARFGHTRDITKLTGTSDEQSDYIQGIIACSILIFCIYLIWCGILIALKCGGKRFGCGAGIPPKRPTMESLKKKKKKVADATQRSGSEEIEEGFELTVEGDEAVPVEQPVERNEKDIADVEISDEEYEWQVKKAERKVTIIRSIFLFSGFMVILFSCILIAAGFKGIQDTVQSSSDSAGLLVDLFSDANVAVTNYINRAEEAKLQRTELVEARGEAGWCPNMGLNGTVSVEVRNETLEFNFSRAADYLNGGLDAASDLVLDKMYDLQKGTLKSKNEALDVQNNLDDTDHWWFYVATVFILVIVVMTMFFMIGTILAWVDRQPKFMRCAEDRVILPIYILFGLLMWIFTTGFLVVTVLTSDFCVDTPDNQVAGILENTMKDTSEVGYDFAVYYVTGCEPELKPPIIGRAYSRIQNVTGAINDFLVDLSTVGPGPLGEACGNNVTALNFGARVLATQFDSMVDFLVDIGRLLLCKSFHPIYAALTYDTLCTTSIDAFSWIYTSMFIISIFSMLIVTLRVSWHELEDEVDDEEERRRSCCGRVMCCRGSLPCNRKGT